MKLRPLLLYSVIASLPLFSISPTSFADDTTGTLITINNTHNYGENSRKNVYFELICEPSNKDGIGWIGPQATSQISFGLMSPGMNTCSIVTGTAVGFNQIIDFDPIGTITIDVGKNSLKASIKSFQAKSNDYNLQISPAVGTEPADSVTITLN